MRWALIALLLCGCESDTDKLTRLRSEALMQKYVVLGLERQGAPADSIAKAEAELDLIYRDIDRLLR